ncbi:MAG: aminotransferase class V-fold PLP-dependent enzyme [Halioglobus sp.]
MILDIDFVHAQFPQYSDNPERVFCSNAGGSYMARQVIDLLQRYNEHTRVQPYYPFQPSEDAGQAMDTARHGWAQALNIDLTELTIGPSTSMNTYVMAQSIGAKWNSGDEIIVTNQDHEANIGVWRRKAEEKGATIREWEIDPETGLLDPQDLDQLLNSRTRWLFFTQCSNVIGTVNPVADIVEKVQALSSAKICVDAVSYSPHHICDLKALGVDMYVFSLYKVFGPHQGMLYVNSSLAEELEGQSHYFNQHEDSKRYNPAGPQHAQIAGCQGVLDYFTALHQHHGGARSDTPQETMLAVHKLMSEQERSLTVPILDYLRESPKVQLLGKNHCDDGDRAATIAFKPLKATSDSVAAVMQTAGIGTENGDFYAPRTIQAMGLERDGGVVRISLLHYNTQQDVEKILIGLDQAL